VPLARGDVSSKVAERSYVERLESGDAGESLDFSSRQPDLGLAL
jgi:hypothetical protein